MRKLILLFLALLVSSCAKDIRYVNVQNPIPSNLLVPQTTPKCTIANNGDLINCLNEYDLRLEGANDQLVKIKQWQSEVLASNGTSE